MNEKKLCIPDGRHKMKLPLERPVHLGLALIRQGRLEPVDDGRLQLRGDGRVLRLGVRAVVPQLDQGVLPANSLGKQSVKRTTFSVTASSKKRSCIKLFFTRGS